MKLTPVAMATHEALRVIQLENAVRKRTRERVLAFLNEAATFEERQWRKMALHAHLYGATPAQVHLLQIKGEKNEG